MRGSYPRAICVSISLSTTNPKSQSRFGTLFFCIQIFHRFARNPISPSAAWLWFFWPCFLVCNCIRMQRASFTKCFPLLVISPAPSATKCLGIPTSSVNSTSDCPALDRAVIGTTFINLTCVNKFARVFPLIEFTLYNKVYLYHVPRSKGLFRWRLSTWSLLDIRWTAVRTQCCVVAASVSFAVCNTIFHFLDNSSGPIFECL